MHSKKLASILLNMCDCSIRVSRSSLVLPVTVSYVLLILLLSHVTVLLEYLDLLYSFYVHFTTNAPIMPVFCSLLLPTHYAKNFVRKIDASLLARHVAVLRMQSNADSLDKNWRFQSRVHSIYNLWICFCPHFYRHNNYYG